MPTDSGKPRFYTTSKHPRETAYKIMGMLSTHGAKRAQMAWDRNDDTGEMEPAAVEFVMEAPMGDRVQDVPVRLKPQVDGLRERLSGISGASDPGWVAWKQLEQLVEAQLEAAANGVREFHEVFMSDILVEAEVGGQFQVVTMGELMSRSKGSLPGDVRLLKPADG